MVELFSVVAFAAAFGIQRPSYPVILCDISQIHNERQNVRPRQLLVIRLQFDNCLGTEQNHC